MGKRLKEILKGLEYELFQGDGNIIVNGICSDSRKVKTGDLFVAVNGTQTDGHKYIPIALKNGASVIIAEKSGLDCGNATYVRMDQTGSKLGNIASNFYGNPSSKLKIVGVTGTNGKTTIVTLLYSLFKELGYRVGLLSTIKDMVDDEIIPTEHTTPDPITINYLMSRMVDKGCEYCFMEASSHAIDQDRISGIDFDGGIFTNITHDHLDYHKTFEAYIKAKKKFFDHLPSTSFALTNSDEKNGMVMLQNTAAKKRTYALKTLADFKCKILEKHMDGMNLLINNKEVYTHLSGTFNAYNVMAVYGAAKLLGKSDDEILPTLSKLLPVTGRFEIMRSPEGKYAIVDYAHTPDALKNILSGIKDIRSKNMKIITVVGAGGDRDRTKRPEMAHEAVISSDKLILTSDNPRSEVPEDIINEMKTGIKPNEENKVLCVTDRKEAIKTACMLAEPGDVVLVAGKGHEDYQEIKGVKHHFNDREVISEIFKL